METHERAELADPMLQDLYDTVQQKGNWENVGLCFAPLLGRLNTVLDCVYCCWVLSSSKAPIHCAGLPRMWEATVGVP